MSIVCHGKLPTGQSGDLEAGPGDLTGRDKLLCYGYHRILNRKNTATNITKTLILKYYHRIPNRKNTATNITKTLILKS